MPAESMTGGRIGRTAWDSSAASVIRDLLAWGLVRVDDVFRHGIVLTETSVSHRSFRVDVGGEPTLFVKQADARRSQGRDLATEAAVYRLAQSSRALAEILPGCRYISADDSLIVLDAVAGRSLAETPIAGGEYAGVGDDQDTGSVLRAYGGAVARAHQIRPLPLGQSPWMLVALEPGWGSYAWLPDPSRGLLLRLAGAPGMRQAFRVAAAAWRAECLIHGDLRWANVLVAADAVVPSVLLVDWELACLGDPAWDIASVLTDLFVAAAGTGAAVARAPLTWEHAHAFLGGYRASAAPAPGRWSDLVERSVRLAGLRLVQALIECGHQGAELLAAMEPALLPWAVELLGGSPAIASELVRHQDVRSELPA